MTADSFLSPVTARGHSPGIFEREEGRRVHRACLLTPLLLRGKLDGAPL